MITNFSQGGGSSYDDTELRNRIGVLETEIPEKADKSEIPEVPNKVSAFENDSEYVSESNLKTINGNSIVGEGDLHIEGGEPYDDTEIRGEIADLTDRVEEIELFSNPNVDIVGNPSIKNGIVSDFDIYNYLKFPHIVHVHDKSWSIKFTFSVDDVSEQHNIFDSEYGLAFVIRDGHCVLAASSNGESWNMGEHVDTYEKPYFDKGESYDLEISFNGVDTYEVKDYYNKVELIQFKDSRTLAPKEIIIGKSVDNDKGKVFIGTINLNKCSLTIDGKLVWEGVNKALDPDLENISEKGLTKISEYTGVDELREDVDNINSQLVSSSKNFYLDNMYYVDGGLLTSNNQPPIGYPVYLDKEIKIDNVRFIVDLKLKRESASEADQEFIRFLKIQDNNFRFIEFGLTSSGFYVFKNNSWSESVQKLWDINIDDLRNIKTIEISIKMKSSDVLSFYIEYFTYDNQHEGISGYYDVSIPNFNSFKSVYYHVTDYIDYYDLSKTSISMFNGEYVKFIYNGSEIFSPSGSLLNLNSKAKENIQSIVKETTLGDFYTKTEIDGKEEVLENKIAQKTDNSDYLQLRDRVEEIELFSTPNLTIFGEPVIQSGQVSGFSVNDYLKFPYLVHLHDNTFSIHICLTTKDLTQQHNILDSEFGLAVAVRDSHFVVAMSSNGTSWDMGEHIGSHTLQPDTTYHIRLSWDKSKYVFEIGDTADDKGEVILEKDFEYEDTKSLYAKEIFIGKGSDNEHIFDGSINLNHCYLVMNGKEVWSGVKSNLDADLSNLSTIGENKVKDLAKLAKIVWYGTQAQYDELEDKTEFSLYIISED